MQRGHYSGKSERSNHLRIERTATDKDELVDSSFFIKLEIDEQPSEVFAVVFDAVVAFLDVRQLKEALYLLAQLSAAFAGDYLHFLDTIFNGLFESFFQGLVNCLAVVVNIMEVDFNAGHS